MVMTWTKLSFRMRLCHGPLRGNRFILMQKDNLDVLGQVMPLVESLETGDIFRDPSLTEVSDKSLTEVPLLEERQGVTQRGCIQECFQRPPNRKCPGVRGLIPSYSQVRRAKGLLLRQDSSELTWWLGEWTRNGSLILLVSLAIMHEMKDPCNDPLDMRIA